RSRDQNGGDGMPKSGEQPSAPRRRGSADRGARGATGRGKPEAGAERAGRAADGANGKGGPGSGPVRPMIELDFLRALIEVVDESGIDSLEITRAGTRIRISKTP